MQKQDLVLINQQGLKGYKIQTNQPTNQPGYDTSANFKISKTDLNSEFLFPRQKNTVCSSISLLLSE